VSGTGAASALEGTTVVVTGANSGMGEATAAALAAMGAITVLTARDRVRGEEAVGRVVARTGSRRVELAVFDLSDLDLVRAGAAALSARHPCIDVPVNNAGLLLGARTETPQGFQTTFATNHLRPLLLTRLLADRSPRPTRRGSSTWRPPPTSWRRPGSISAATSRRRATGPRASTRAPSSPTSCSRPNWRTGSRARDHGELPAPRDRPIRVGQNGDASGLWAIGMAIANPFMTSPEKGVATSVYLAWSPSVAATSGAYFAKCKEVARRRPPPTRSPPGGCGT